MYIIIVTDVSYCSKIAKNLYNLYEQEDDNNY